jgi:hypothetical protein
MVCIVVELDKWLERILGFDFSLFEILTFGSIPTHTFTLTFPTPFGTAY